LQQNREQELKDPVIQFITHKPYGNYSGLELLFKPKAYVRKSLVKIMERVHKKNPALYTREAMDRDLAYIRLLGLKKVLPNFIENSIYGGRNCKFTSTIM
jgi:hypothetical protein